MKIYNTLTRKKEELVPINEGCIKMYTCGQTVYNHIHMGNARFYVIFDAIRRYLEYRGYKVEFVQNFTDIDDKIITRSLEENTTTEEIAEKYIKSTINDLAALNVKPATINPRATEEIDEIIKMVQELISKGNAYEVNGTVYYNITTFSDYGKLSKKNINDLEAGARIAVEEGKTNPMDFVLWKPAKPNEPYWQSPWGNGRPGWHIECSAMIRKYLGDEIDIHGGGDDLVFPHHENEIAQTEAITGKNFAKVWMHSGILTTDHKKMSKSRGNFATLKEVAEKTPHDIIRFFFLSGHYRMPMEFTDEVLTAAKQGLTRIINCHNNLNHAIENAKSQNPITQEQLNQLENYKKSFEAAMDDDFNTADAITAIFELVKFINVSIENSGKGFMEKAHDTLIQLTDILGIKIKSDESNSDAEIDEMVAARQAARKNKDFAESDRIRDELLSRGIVLEDTREGVRWRRG